MSFWNPNIERGGRILRALTGVVMISSGVALLRLGWVIGGWSLVAFGVFCGYEAVRGWCVARACGLKTPR